LIHIPASEADEIEPKAIISLDQSKVDVDINLTELNFGTVTGSVIVNLNETEYGILRLYANVEGFTTIIAPNTFFVDSNSSSLRFTVDTHIPEGFLGGEVRLLEVYGNITLQSDNSSIHPVQPAFTMISINPVYSINVELKDPIIEVSPAKKGTFQMIIANHGRQGIFKIEIEDLSLLQENEYSISVNPSTINLSSMETGYVNITVDLPDLWTLWTDRVDSITINVTNEDGEVLGSTDGYLKVEGTFIGGMEGFICPFFIVMLVLLVLVFIIDVSTRGTKEERNKRTAELREMKRELKIAKKEMKMRKKGVFLDNEESNEPESVPEPQSCPYCGSTNIKTLLSGKLKCRSCEKIIAREEK
jgi:hypothetical protein